MPRSKTSYEVLAEHGVVAPGAKGAAWWLRGASTSTTNALSETQTLGSDDLRHGRWAMVRVGKKRRHVLRVTSR